MSVTRFKDQSLRLIAQVAETGEGLVITRHGKPLARLVSVDSRELPVLGKQKGAMTLLADITGPVAEQDWDADR